MGRVFNPFGLEWHVSSAAQACNVIVKKAFMSGVVTFANTDGAALASLTHSLCSTSSKLHWKGSTYRCITGPVPLLFDYTLQSMPLVDYMSCPLGTVVVVKSEILASLSSRDCFLPLEDAKHHRCFEGIGHKSLILCSLVYTQSLRDSLLNMDTLTLPQSSFSIVTSFNGGDSNLVGLPCRWETTHTGLPLTLQLINLATNTMIARLKGAASTPWSKEQYVLTVAAGQYGPTWLQVVAVSAIAEAQRVNGKFSSSGAGATLAAM